jgi:hypothetical protein
MSVVGRLLFICVRYAADSTIIYKLAANRHLCADKSKLLMSFSAFDFCRGISHFENTISFVQN